MVKALLRMETDSPQLVVAHANWQKKRGRRPSMGFMDERNPVKALELARDILFAYRPESGEPYNNIFPASIYPAKHVEPDVFEVELLAGSEIGQTIAEAIEMAGYMSASIQFNHNDVVVRVRSDSKPRLIYRDWKRCIEGCIDGIVGPYPRSRLSQDELETIVRVREELDRQIAEERRAYAMRSRKPQEVVAAVYVLGHSSMN
jgi:hypothetical protein